MIGTSPYSNNTLTAHDLKRIGLALGGQPDGKGWRARCPVQDDQNPSLSLRSGDTVSLLVKCWAGCDPKDILAELRRRGLLDDPAEPRQEQPRTQRLEPPLDARAKVERVLVLCQPIRGTVAERYLRDFRGVDLPSSGDALRFLPAKPPAFPHPAMVAVVTDFADAGRLMDGTIHLLEARWPGQS
jgi:putative DNA primase/helicase